MHFYDVTATAHLGNKSLANAIVIDNYRGANNVTGPPLNGVASNGYVFQLSFSHVSHSKLGWVDSSLIVHRTSMSSHERMPYELASPTLYSYGHRILPADQSPCSKIQTVFCHIPLRPMCVIAPAH